MFELIRKSDNLLISRHKTLLSAFRKAALLQRKSKQSGSFLGIKIAKNGDTPSLEEWENVIDHLMT
jgi:hypothetical protein